ncbi:MAG: MBL fold metallo-hydrolase [Armatimonadota bacterium]
MFISLLPENTDFVQPRCSAHASSLAGTPSFVLDNGIFSLSILPEYGGRLCSLFYRPLNLELLATGMTSGPQNTLKVRGGWCAAFPSLLPEGEQISHVDWEGEIAENTPERVAVRLWCLVDRVSHILEGKVRVTPGTIVVERFVRLNAGEPAVVVEDVLTNRNIWPLPTTWSSVISLRARPGDRVIVPVDTVEVQRGVGPSGNELDFGLVMTTPFQAFARDLQENWLGFRPAGAPVDVRITFPRDLLPHAAITAQRNDNHPEDDSFRLQPMATRKPIADDLREGALPLPPKQPLRLPIRLEVGTNLITAGEWSRPGLQLADIITEQRVPSGRIAVWRAGARAIVMKTHRHLVLLLPESGEGSLLPPEDLPDANMLLYAESPSGNELRSLSQRSSARFLGPPLLRQQLLAEGAGEERALSFSPGVRFDVPGLGVLATPARNEASSDFLGYLLQIEHLSVYHTGPTQFLGEFGPIGEQFHPQLVFLPLGADITMADAVQAAKILQPRVVVPLGTVEEDREFAKRCRAQHLAFAVETLAAGEGRIFDGWHLREFEGQ